MTGWRSPEAIESFQQDLADPRHGTENGYKNYRCRCDACCAVRSEIQKTQKERRSQNIDPKDSRHGTLSFYVAHKCRCARCTAANAASSREWGWAQGREPTLYPLPKPPPVLENADPFRRNQDDPRHGTEDGYALGCRCRRCRAAQREDRQ